MPPADRLFTLCETVSGVFGEICDAYAIDSSWLSWQYERAVWTGKVASPMHLTTNALHQKRPMKDGVDKVMFEIEFDTERPNYIKCIRFTEHPSKKVFLVTQTSIDHVREDTKCPFWIELPPAARKEDIGAVVALLRVDICCNNWKDSLPKEPHTALERAHLVVANEDKSWLKNQLILKGQQVILKDQASRAMSNALATKTFEVDELKKEVERLQRELEEEKAAQRAPREMRTPSPPRKKNRKTATPRRSAAPTAPQPPNTAPAKTNGYDGRHLVPAQTPTRARLVYDDGGDRDDEILY